MGPTGRCAAATVVQAAAACAGALQSGAGCSGSTACCSSYGLMLVFCTSSPASHQARRQEPAGRGLAQLQLRCNLCGWAPCHLPTVHPMPGRLCIIGGHTDVCCQRRQGGNSQGRPGHTGAGKHNPPVAAPRGAVWVPAHLPPKCCCVLQLLQDKPTLTEQAKQAAHDAKELLT